MKKASGRSAVVGRFFRGLPVVDAIEPLMVVVNKRDIAKATPKDPNNCAFAQACRRAFDSHAVLFLRRHAYVDLPDAKGRRYVNRFVFGGSVGSKIVNFDSTGKMGEGGFILNPPPESQSLDYKERYAVKYRREVKAGKRQIKHTKPNKRHIRAMYGVRDGRGKLGINYAF